MDDKKWIQRLAFAYAKGLGPAHARELLARLGSVEAVFAESESALAHLVGKALAHEILLPEHMAFAEKELRFMRANGVQTVFLGDKDYPFRLRECQDAPVLFFYKGTCSLNAAKMLAVVGTRSITDMGKSFTSQVVEDLAKRHPDLVVVSGLAYGVDAAAHRAALKSNVCTIGVMATGMDKVYPALHAKLASQMKVSGGLITEHFRGDSLTPGCFVSRNRIIAGLCDAVLVVESAADGGALTTADIANSYSREVLAVPGRPGDKYSEGCNNLIKENKAAMVCSASDIEYQLGWDSGKQRSHVHTSAESVAEGLSEQEILVVSVLRKAGKLDVADLSHLLNTPLSQLSALLFDMEMRGLIHKQPGNMYSVGK